MWCAVCGVQCAELFRVRQIKNCNPNWKLNKRKKMMWLFSYKGGHISNYILSLFTYRMFQKICYILQMYTCWYSSIQYMNTTQTVSPFVTQTCHRVIMLLRLSDNVTDTHKVVICNNTGQSCLLLGRGSTYSGPFDQATSKD